MDDDPLYDVGELIVEVSCVLSFYYAFGEGSTFVFLSFFLYWSDIDVLVDEVGGLLGDFFLDCLFSLLRG